MKKTKLLTAVVFSLALLHQFNNTVLAQEVEQSVNQEQEVEVICETGAYGQTTCYVKGSQTQEAVQVVKTEGDIVYIEKDGEVIPVKKHEVVDTASSGTTTAILASIMLFGGLATVNKIKNRA